MKILTFDIIFIILKAVVGHAVAFAAFIGGVAGKTKGSEAEGEGSLNLLFSSGDTIAKSGMCMGIGIYHKSKPPFCESNMLK